VFTLCYTGDMPQQQENAGFKTQRADLGCRFCFIKAPERNNLDFDIQTLGRYHHQTIAMRKEKDSLRTKTAREDFMRDNGMAESAPLTRISPALDLILTRPPDPAHSEYAGQAKLMHALLLETILTTAGARSYATTLCG